MGLLGFVGWLLSLVFQLSAPGYLGYITGHLERWAAKVSLWGLPILLVGLISLGVPILIRKNEFLAFILGNFAFFLGFMINMIVAYNPPAHLFVGALVGWLLLMPLIFYVIRLKKSSEEIHSQEKISVNK
jgi:hypothetical protein